MRERQEAGGILERFLNNNWASTAVDTIISACTSLGHFLLHRVPGQRGLVGAAGRGDIRRRALFFLFFPFFARAQQCARPVRSCRRAAAVFESAHNRALSSRGPGGRPLAASRIQSLSRVASFQRPGPLPAPALVPSAHLSPG